jgi:hypothetical protein
MAGEQIACVT